MIVDISGFTIALWYLEQAVRLANEVKRLAIQAQGFADLAEELRRINESSLLAWFSQVDTLETPDL